MDLFFCPGEPFGSSAFNDLLGILLHQIPKLPVVFGMNLDLLGLIPGHITRDSLSIFPALQIIVGPLGTLANHAEFSGFHLLNSANLVKQFRSRYRCCHAEKYIRTYIPFNKNTPFLSCFQNLVMHP